MNPNGDRFAAHAEDLELIRLLDDELSPGDRARVRAHVAACDTCGRRFARLRRRSDAFGSLLARADPGAPHGEPMHAEPTQAVRGGPPGVSERRFRGRTSSRRALVRAAVFVTVLVSAVLAASPAGAWLGAQWQRTAALLAPGGAPAERSTDGSGRAVRTTVSFVPADARLLIEFDHFQDHGELELRAGSSATAAMSVTASASRDAEMGVLVLPSGIRVRNRQEARADYELVVPTEVRAVQIRIADRPAAAIDVDALAGVRRIVELSRGHP